MRKSGQFLVPLIVLILSLVACDDGTPTGGGSSVVQNIPNSIGMLWRYEVNDSLAHTTDTVWVSVTDTLTAAGELAVERRNKRLRGEYVTFQFFFEHGDTIEIFLDYPVGQPYETFVLPFSKGNVWNGPAGPDDTSVVAEVGPVTLPTGRFYGSARIDRVWGRDFEGGGNWSRTWVVPNVGVASMHLISKYSDGANITVTRNESWVLIDYDLSTFEVSAFPRRMGDVWYYQQVDSADFGPGPPTVVWDTVMITTIATCRLDSACHYAIQEVVSDSGVDTQYVMLYADQIRIQQDSLVSPLRDVLYQLPLAVGRSWGIYTYGPVPDIVDKEQIVAPREIFPSCFHGRTYGGFFESSWIEEDWLCPGVGIVRSSRREYNFPGQTSRTRLLINYNVGRNPDI